MARDLRMQLWQLLCEIDGVDEGSSAFAERDAPALWVDGVQVVHFVGDDALEVRLTKKRISADRAALKTDPRVALRRNTSDWLVVKFSGASDLSFARELVAAAVDAHKPPEGRPSRPPPAGAELARRRRFH